MLTRDCPVPCTVSVLSAEVEALEAGQWSPQHLLANMALSLRYVRFTLNGV